MLFYNINIIEIILNTSHMYFCLKLFQPLFDNTSSEFHKEIVYLRRCINVLYLQSRVNMKETASVLRGKLFAVHCESLVNVRILCRR